MSNPLRGIAQDLRNAYDSKSRSDHEDALRRLERLGNLIPADGCTRGDLCVCNKHIKDVCMYRVQNKT